MKFGYARVSTKNQNLEIQLDAFEKNGVERIFTEKESGAKNDRKELERCLDMLREGDTLVVYKLDRLARSTKHLIELGERLEEMGVHLVSICDSIDTTSPTGKAMFKMLGVIAELERDIIVERTRAGLESARARGRVGGRPKKSKDKVQQAFRLYDSKEYSISEIVDMTGISKATLFRKLKERS
ncbi:recombinase family protein [Bacillus haikouensis]|jgi:DNA invertase Pin-like site-specific DNA recombinase|uniref:recombinase family protein n=1 Tax=Bacillus haikouensis TaxID=1510468 RepID=UPI001555589B|nr:recombinase family protein [Bacillus haikouensis]NQD64314.1 recombinase family protein [Bacillus haikouensis]